MRRLKFLNVASVGNSAGNAAEALRMMERREGKAHFAVDHM
jgi:hypothetical protein